MGLATDCDSMQGRVFFVPRGPLHFRYIGMAAAAAGAEECSDAFICPVTLEVMRDPVYFEGDEDLHTIERAAAMQWVAAGNRTHPVTGVPLTSIAVRPKPPSSKRDQRLA
jgi:hypothetical protein